MRKERDRLPTRFRGIGSHILLMALTLSACGDVTGGGAGGEIEVVVAADSVLVAQTLAQLTALADEGSGPIEGTLTARVRSFIGGEVRGEWQELTEGPQEVTLPLDGSEVRVLARANLPPGSYVGTRTIFGRVEAVVTRGLTVDGQPITGTVPVDIGPTGMLEIIEPNLLVEVGADRTTELAIELNSRIWLRLLNRVNQQVDPRDFRGVVRVRVKSR